MEFDSLNLKLEDDQIVGIMAAQMYATNPNMAVSGAVRHSFEILDEIQKQKKQRDMEVRKERLKR